MNNWLLRLAGSGLVLLGVLLLSRGVERLLAPNSFLAIVRLKVERDLQNVSFDPYWVQDQLETLQSKPVLYRVITNLNLTLRRAEEFRKPDLIGIEAAYARLKKQIGVHQIRGASLFEVSVAGEDPNEAAAIANEIAEVFISHRARQRHGVKQQGISILEAELEKINLAISNKQAEAQALKASLGTNGSESRILDDLKWKREKLNERIIQEKEDDATPGTRLIEILDRAQPPLRPRDPKTGMAIACVFGGLGAIVVGMLLLRKGKAPGLTSQS